MKKRVTAISFDTLVRIQNQRMGDRYSVQTIRDVLDMYTSSTFGILARIERQEEFKDKFFGSFRYTEKGFESFKTEVTELMRKKLIMAKIVHETMRRKKGHEKRNRLVWMIGNAIEGYRYVYKMPDIKKVKINIKIRQNYYHTFKRRAGLKIAKKVRRSIKN